ncbi:MAG: hypothetical protein AB1422_16650 [bacterium]
MIFRGKFRCNYRKLHDPDAAWGYDSYHDRFVYGHSIHLLSDSKNDLPVLIKLTPANRHDSVITPLLLFSAKNIHQYSFTNAAFDTASDNYPTYRLATDYWKINLFIPLRETTKSSQIKLPRSIIKFTDKGTPVCLNNMEMYCWGFCKDRSRIKWRCLLVALKSTPDLKSCPHHLQCSTSDYGRVVFTKPEWDYRLFTPIPRETPLWEKYYDERSGCERLNKRLTKDYKLDEIKTTGTKRWFFRATIASICIHIDAWWTQLNREKSNTQLKE